jgi:hypothetical protein
MVAIHQATPAGTGRAEPELLRETIAPMPQVGARNLCADPAVCAGLRRSAGRRQLHSTSTSAVIFAGFAVACHGWCDPTGAESTRPSSFAGVRLLRRSGRLARRGGKGFEQDAHSLRPHPATPFVGVGLEGRSARRAAPCTWLPRPRGPRWARRSGWPRPWACSAARCSDGNSSVALRQAHAWLPNHAGNERPHCWSLASEPGGDLSHDCPVGGRGLGDDSGGGRPPLGHADIGGACATGRAQRSPGRRFTAS